MSGQIRDRREKNQQLQTRVGMISTNTKRKYNIDIGTLIKEGTITDNQRRNNDRNRMDHESTEKSTRFPLCSGTRSNTPNNTIRTPKRTGQNQNRQTNQIL